MILTREHLSALALRTLTDPRAAALQLINAGIPGEARWPLLALVVLASTLLSGVLNLMSPAEGPMALLLSRPFVSAGLTFAGLLIMIYALHWTGRSLGGTGDVLDMVLVMSWLQFMLFMGQIAILLVALALPPLGAFLFLAYLGYSIWMAVAFVDAVHRFDNYFKSLGVILLSLLAIGITLSILFSALGLGSSGVPNSV